MAQDKDVTDALNTLQKLGWTQAALARHFHYHRQAVGDWFRKRANPKRTVGNALVKMATDKVAPPGRTA